MYVKIIYTKLLTNATIIDDYVCHTSNQDSQEDINKIIYYTARHQEVGVILVVHSIFKVTEARPGWCFYFLILFAHIFTFFRRPNSTPSVWEDEASF